MLRNREKERGEWDNNQQQCVGLENGERSLEGEEWSDGPEEQLGVGVQVAVIGRLLVLLHSHHGEKQNVTSAIGDTAGSGHRRISCAPITANHETNKGPLGVTESS
jgi:hypothetical protein